jgi:hypothetical protein
MKSTEPHSRYDQQASDERDKRQDCYRGDISSIRFSVSREKVYEERTATRTSDDRQSKHESANDGMPNSPEFENLSPLRLVGQVVLPRAKKPWIGRSEEVAPSSFFEKCIVGADGHDDSRWFQLLFRTIRDVKLI